MRILDATIEASLGRVWWYRSPLLIPVAWIFYRHVTDSEYESIFAGINLAIHEGGASVLHVVRKRFPHGRGRDLSPMRLPDCHGDDVL